MRKARCLHRLGGRFKAIEAYQEVLDYFPNRVRYAAAALYYQGLCHWRNGEEAKAVYHYVRGNPNEPKLREPYAKADTLDPYYPAG